MGHVLVIHAEEGFTELVRRALSGMHEVRALRQWSPRAISLLAGSGCDAVLCGIRDPKAAIETCLEVSKAWPKTRVVPIAASAAEVRRFVERWNADPARKEIYSRIGSVWISERFSTGQLLALFNKVEQTQSEKLDTPKATYAKPTQTPASGAVIDGYRLICVIEEGGFGKSWMAVNEVTDKLVAMKIIEDEEQIEQELDALRKYVQVACREEHLVLPKHVSRDASRLWIVTPLADSMTGGYSPDTYKPLSLSNRLSAIGHLPEREAIRIAIGVLRALGTLHGAGLLHGDVSPPNILSMHGNWVVSDPGLVRFVGQHGICRDQRYYPLAASVRPSDNLYAVGVTLWDMTSGASEVVSGKERLRLDKQMLSFLARNDTPILKVICRSVAENPDGRYMNVTDMLQDLEALLADLTRDTATQYTLSMICFGPSVPALNEVPDPGSARLAME